MRLSDDELLGLIWRNQLRLVAAMVLDHYVGGRYGLRGTSESDYNFASAEHVRSRARITDRLGPRQLLKRLRGLQATGRLFSVYGKNLLTFRLDDERSREAFDLSRQWWLDHGMPTGYTQGAGANVKAYAKPQIEAMVAACQQYLANHFGVA